MEVKGKIKLIGETKEYGNNGFRKRELVITTEEQYPQHLLIEFIQDNTEKLTHFSVGQDVNVAINLKGREWTNPKGETVYFNTIQGWRIEKLTPEPVGNQAPPMPPANQFPPLEDLTSEDEKDDLPF